ncbi:MAG: hypothetical protein AAF657_28125, partial [Acidobacteriota bacterium]
MRLAALALCLGCTTPNDEPFPILQSSGPIHLEAQLESARIEGAEIPEGIPEARDWRFDAPNPDWQPVSDPTTVLQLASSDAAPDALHIDLSPAVGSSRRLWGAVYTELTNETEATGWHPGDWDVVLLRARSTGGLRKIGIKFNRQGNGADEEAWQVHAEEVDAINDGLFQSYLMRVDIKVGKKVDIWQQLAIHFYTAEATPATLEIESVRVIPKAARFLAAPTGSELEGRDGEYRRVLYAHAPARLTYRLQVPSGGRLDFAMGASSEATPVAFEVLAKPDGGASEVLFAESWSDRNRWGQRQVNLTAYAGQVIDLTLVAEAAGADAEGDGTVALWGAPTVSGRLAEDDIAQGKPNIILYVIDGGGADYMSTYGYSRPTTP